jgi:hypothetical protein
MMTGDELVARIGEQATYELAVLFAEEGRAFTMRRGTEGNKARPDRRERNLEIVRLWLLEKLPCTDVGARAGVSRSRVNQILHWLYGFEGRGSTLRATAAEVPVLREALVMELARAASKLHAAIWRHGHPDLRETLAAFDEVRSLVREVGVAAPDVEQPVELWVGRKRRSIVLAVLRDQLAIERDLADTHDAEQRARAEANVRIVERLLRAVP